MAKTGERFGGLRLLGLDSEERRAKVELNAGPAIITETASAKHKPNDCCGFKWRRLVVRSSGRKQPNKHQSYTLCGAVSSRQGALAAIYLPWTAIEQPGQVPLPRLHASAIANHAVILPTKLNNTNEPVVIA